MKEKEQVLVTGAAGWIGRNVCRYLKQMGRNVIACDIKPGDGPWDAFVQCDISEEAGFPEAGALDSILSRDASYYLVHCAGHAHRPVETAKDKLCFENINAEGTRRTLKWAEAIGVSRFLYVSSIAFYDWSLAEPGSPLDERAEVSGTTAYARSKLKGEEFVRSSCLDTRIVRLSTVFGEGDPANFSKLARALKRRRFLLPGNGSARKSVISVDKAGEWIAGYSLMDNPEHSLINLGFRNAPTLREICEVFHTECGFSMPKSVPVGALRGLGSIGNLIARWKPEFPLTTGTVRKLTQSTRVDCSRAAAMFDINCDFSTSLRESSDYYRSL